MKTVSEDLLDAGLRLIDNTTERLARESVANDWRTTFHVTHLALQSLRQTIQTIKDSPNAHD